MYALQIHVQCYGRFLEVAPNEVENAALLVEDVVSRILLDLFGGGTVDDVSICFSSFSHASLYRCSIHIHAQALTQGISLLPRPKRIMELAVEKSVIAPLRELFGSVN